MWLCEFNKKRRESKLLKLQLGREQDTEQIEREVEYLYPYVVEWIYRKTMGVLTKKSISKKDFSRLFPDASEETQDAMWNKLLREKVIYREKDLPGFYIAPKSEDVTCDNKTERNR